MRKKNREKIINLTTEILEAFLRVGGAGAHAFLDQKTLYSDLNSRGYDREIISTYVRRLVNSGHLEAIEESGKRSVRLTRKGKVKRLEKTNESSADGKWRVISYDIPDDRKPLRIALTRSLRRIGYKPVQKSLWVCPFNKADEIEILISELGINIFVANFKVESSDIEEHLRELFDDELD
ncbi:MAG: hypothetical protein NTY30_04870 [Candidatus Berkelbacteria bacterium]|nr:hypothetical protein [Candidatus Berkelbacteria bacterium]